MAGEALQVWLSGYVLASCSLSFLRLRSSLKDQWEDLVNQVYVVKKPSKWKELLNKSTY